MLDFSCPTILHRFVCVKHENASLDSNTQERKKNEDK